MERNENVSRRKVLPDVANPGPVRTGPGDGLGRSSERLEGVLKDLSGPPAPGGVPV